MFWRERRHPVPCFWGLVSPPLDLPWAFDSSFHFLEEGESVALLGGVPWMELLAIAAGASMLVGSILAVRQTSMKRLLAYLVVAHSGFLLTALLVSAESESIAVMLYQLVFELFSLVGVFLSVAIIYNKFKSDQLSYFNKSINFRFMESVFSPYFSCFLYWPSAISYIFCKVCSFKLSSPWGVASFSGGYDFLDGFECLRLFSGGLFYCFRIREG